MELSAQLDLTLTSLLYAHVAIGGASPFDRPRFRYTSGAIAFETPAVGGRGDLALGLRF